MQPRHAWFALLCLLASCGSDTPVTPGPVAQDPGPVVTVPGTNLGLSADSICMQALLGGIDPRDDDVRITSLTGSEISGLTATIAYGPGQPTGWLTTSFSQTTTPSRLWLHATTGTVPRGAWWADVTVTAPNGGTPRVIRMHFTVLEDTGILVTVELGASAGHGRVTGYGMDCNFTVGSQCAQRYADFTALTLTATPDPGNRFVRWGSPACPEPEKPTCTLTNPDGDVTVTVYFSVEGAQALVNLELGGFTILDLSPGTGTVTGSGFDCDFMTGSLCSQHLPIGTVLTLRATPDPNNRFLCWSTTPQNCPDFSMDPQYSVTLTGDLTITAYFYLLGYGISVTVVGAGADGLVEAPDGSDLPGGISCQLVAGVQSGKCSALQWYGARSTGLSAYAPEGSVFVGWTGCSAVNVTACELDPLPGGGYSVTATFAKQ